eukprot:481078-Pleurochrysis_carterae.AAC.2
MGTALTRSCSGAVHFGQQRERDQTTRWVDGLNRLGLDALKCKICADGWRCNSLTRSLAENATPGELSLGEPHATMHGGACSMIPMSVIQPGSTAGREFHGKL